MTIKGPTMTDAKLEPCPWHEAAKLPPTANGYMMGTAEELQTDTDKWAYTVRCYCGAQGPERDTEAAAITAWNTRTATNRASEGELREALAEVRACLAEIPRPTHEGLLDKTIAVLIEHIDAALVRAALSAKPDPEATRTELVERGFDKAVAAIRSWKGHGLSASTDERLEAVAHDLETNKATILAREQAESADAP